MSRGRKDENPAKDTACSCGCLVKAVIVGGNLVNIDKGADPHGEIGAVKINGVWQYRDDAETLATAVYRYSRHRCQATAQYDLRRRADAGDTAGPCARCHQVQVPRRYGADPEMFCPSCTEKRAAGLARWASASS